MFIALASARMICAALCTTVTLGATTSVTGRTSNNLSIDAQPTKAVETVVITEAWARPALKGGTGGVYMTITNSGTTAVRISRATSLDARAVELHESSDHNGMAHMQLLPTLEIAAGASATLKPGGKHFMLIGLRRKFVVRDTMRVVLLVESLPKASSVKSTAPRARVITALAAVRVL